MSAKPPRYASWTAGKLPLPELLEIKRRGEKIVMVTAYDAPSGRLADAAGGDPVAAARAALNGLTPDYVELLDLDGALVLASAVRVGSIRLIDNVLLQGELT